MSYIYIKIIIKNAVRNYFRTAFKNENYLIKLNNFRIYQASSSVQRAAPDASASPQTPWTAPVKPAGISK